MMVHLSRVVSLSILMLLALICLMSCMQAHVSLYPGYRFPPADPKKVEIFDGAGIYREYVVIGRIEMDAAGRVSDASLHERLRKVAARQGGDAVILTDRYESFSTYQSGAAASRNPFKIGADGFDVAQPKGNTHKRVRRIVNALIIKFAAADQQK